MSFVRVNKAHPCPVCGRPDWCLLAEDGSAAICARISDGAARRLIHLHRADGAPGWGGAPKEDRPTPTSLFDSELPRTSDGSDGSARHIEDLNADERVAWEERVASCMNDGGLSQAEAEELAWQEVESSRRPPPATEPGETAGPGG